MAGRRLGGWEGLSLSQVASGAGASASGLWPFPGVLLMSPSAGGSGNSLRYPDSAATTLRAEVASEEGASQAQEAGVGSDLTASEQ